MRHFHAIVNGRRRDAGYALLMVLFLVTLMVLAAMVAGPQILMKGRREKEQETIWRGQQYARAVRLYYRKFGRFPQSVEDLTKPKDNLRFLRRAYQDPLNDKDGSWRLIYVGPAGQLIGSVKQKAALTGFGSLTPGKPAPSKDTSGAKPTGGKKDSEGPPQKEEVPLGEPQSIAGTLGDGKVIGGNIIGVGCKEKHPSIIVYDDADNYHDWEFIWDPSKDVVPAGQAPKPPGQNGSGPQPISPRPDNMRSPPNDPN